MKIKRLIMLLVHRVPMVLGTLALLICFTGIRPVAAQSPAFVRVIHASPDVGTADVFVDGSVFLSSFQFGAVTDYAPVPSGPHKVQIALVGKGIGASVISETLAVTPGVAYTVAAIGTSATGLSLEVFIDNNFVAGNTAKLRVYQLSPDAGSVSVVNGNSTLLSSIMYKQASGYLTIAPNSYTWKVNTSNLSSGLPVSETLTADTVTSLFAVGLVNGTPGIQVVAAQTNGTPGMPSTGSNPGAVPQQNTQGLSPWMWGILIVLMIGLGAISLGRDITRQITILRSRG
ncbi:MAG: DUF4397 domain-containing protein [Ktedonobacteraceae bacterium]